MARQAILDGGPLLGRLQLKNISYDDLDVVVNDRVGDERYVRLGKKIVRLVYTPLSRLINILRINYGQYWIKELNKWDSREESLGAYCRGTLGMSWSIDDGNTWQSFRPTEQVLNLTGSLASDETWNEFLVEQDFRLLADIVQGDYEPSLAATTVAVSHRLVDQGSLRYGFIEGVSALELALHEFIRRKVQNSTLLENLSSFWNLPLRTQVIAVLSIRGNTSQQDIELAVKVIELRHKIVHEGWDPPYDSSNIEAFYGLLRIVTLLLSVSQFKFPKINVGNQLYAPDTAETPN